MRQLIPTPSDPVDLDAVYAYRVGRPWLRANMVSSLDGAATAEGTSEGLSGPADRRVLGVLRALADVIIVGAGTARAENYRPIAARPSYAARRAGAGQLPAAAVAVVSARLDLDLHGPLLAGPTAAPTVVLTTSSAPGARLAAVRERAEVVVAGTDCVDLPKALDALVARGWRRMLCEGGPSMIAQLAAAGRLDELCLTLAPQLRAGAASRILAGPELTTTARLELASLLEEDGYLFTRYVASR